MVNDAPTLFPLAALYEGVALALALATLELVEPQAGRVPEGLDAGAVPVGMTDFLPQSPAPKPGFPVRAPTYYIQFSQFPFA